jgi:Uma2 family endonuclease
MSAQPATASPLLHRYTLKEFFALDRPTAGGHYELIAGVLYMVPPPSGSHSLVVSHLVAIFGQYTTNHPRGCMLFVPRAPVWTAADTYLEPDVFLISARHLKMMDVDHLTTADLVVEVMSPGSAIYDRTAKADTYAALGVRELWLVDLETQSIEQRRLRGRSWQVVGVFGRRQIVKSSAFRGLEVEVSEVFAS